MKINKAKNALGDECFLDGVDFSPYPYSPPPPLLSAYLKFSVKWRCYWPIITTSVIIDHCHFNKQLSTFRGIFPEIKHAATKPASLHLSRGHAASRTGQKQGAVGLGAARNQHSNGVFRERESAVFAWPQGSASRIHYFCLHCFVDTFVWKSWGGGGGWCQCHSIMYQGYEFLTEKGRKKSDCVHSAVRAHALVLWNTQKQCMFQDKGVLLARVRKRQACDSF